MYVIVVKFLQDQSYNEQINNVFIALFVSVTHSIGEWLPGGGGVPPGSACQHGTARRGRMDAHTRCRMLAAGTITAIFNQLRHSQIPQIIKVNVLQSWKM